MPILFALTEKDIEKYDVYPFLPMSRGLCAHSEDRAYAVRNLQRYAERFLRHAIASKEEAKLLSEMLVPEFDSFQKRIRPH